MVDTGEGRGVRGREGGGRVEERGVRGRGLRGERGLR